MIILPYHKLVCVINIFFCRVDLLGPFMHLLELISLDRELKDHLAKNSFQVVGTTPRGATITNEDLPKVCL